MLVVSTTPSIKAMRLAVRQIVSTTPYYRFGLIVADGDDNKFVDCCIATGASFIVSNDRHFDVLADIPFPHVEVLNIGEFSKSLLKNPQTD